MLLKTILILYQLVYLFAPNNAYFEEENSNCISPNLMERYGLNTQIYRSCEGGSSKSNDTNTNFIRKRRLVLPIFRGKPKPRSEILATRFHMDSNYFDQTNSLVKLVNKIAKEYLDKCPPVIYYDSFLEKSDGLILESLFKTFPITFFHGKIDENYRIINPILQQRIDNNCKSYILFLSEPLMASKILGPQTESRVVLVARSTQWRLRDFLASPKSSNLVNLLVIGESLTVDAMNERAYVLYTHNLYVDGLGSNRPVVLTSWIRGALSRPHINLFPPKFQSGFAGHRFQVCAANQPPFIFRLKSLSSGGSTNIHWDGIEYRLLNTIGIKLNFSVEISEPVGNPNMRSTVDVLQWEVARKAADIGMSGIFTTVERLNKTDMSVSHSRDCAAFITLASKALPRYRAIMGPFQWPVWACIVFIYLFAIFPIVYSDRLTLKHLIGNWGEIENMFWYVFGMFTNSLTFSGKYSWGSTKKTSTRLLIGSYWLFTIIITSCYTGSIIAFVTLPAFPDTVDSIMDLLGLFFRVSTLDNGGWETWFQNSTHLPTAKLYKKMEFVSTLEEGIGNVTQSFFWNYAFLGSASQLEYLVQSNYSDENISRRSVLHISDECFALFQIGLIFPKDAVYKHKIDSMILLAQQSGIMNKIYNEVKWVMQRSSSGKLLQANAASSLRERIQEERQLTTADTEGMFLLMGIGYLVGAIALISEIVGGITNKCRQIMKRSRKSFSSSAWSSKRNSIATDNCDAGAVGDLVDGDGAIDRALVKRKKVEQKAHDKRKAERRAIDERGDDYKHQGFGRREFNLTKKTLKELYSSYYKPEPSYVLKDGKLILETGVSSSASTDGHNSSDSSSDVKKIMTRGVNKKKKTMVVAEIDIEQKKIRNHVDDDTAVEDNHLTQTLAVLDNCLAAHRSSFDNAMESNADDEEVLFGSFVKLQEVDAAAAELSKDEHLNLFNIEKDLDNLDRENSRKRFNTDDEKKME